MAIPFKILAFLTEKEHKQIWKRAEAINPTLMRLVNSAKTVREKRIILDKYRPQIEAVFNKAYKQLSAIDPTFAYPKIMESVLMEAIKSGNPQDRLKPPKGLRSLWDPALHPRSARGQFVSTPAVSTGVGMLSRKTAINRNIHFIVDPPPRQEPLSRERVQALLNIQADKRLNTGSYSDREHALRKNRFDKYMRTHFPAEIARMDSVQATAVDRVHRMFGIGKYAKKKRGRRNP